MKYLSRRISIFAMGMESREHGFEWIGVRQYCLYLSIVPDVHAWCTNARQTLISVIYSPFIIFGIGVFAAIEANYRFS